MSPADTIRVLNNAVILLERGLYPGGESEAVLEALRYLAGLRDSLKAEVEKAEPPASPAPVKRAMKARK